MPDCNSGSDWLSFLFFFFLFSCPVVFYTLHPQTVALRSPLSMGTEARILEAAMPFYRDLPDPGLEPMSPVLASKFLLLSH